MTQLMLDIFPLGLVLMFLYKARPCLKGFNEGYLDLDSCRPIRGFFALFVIIHHLSQHVLGGRILPMFVYFGNLPVALFFFFSGYGVMKKYLAKPDYGRKFIRRHLPPLIILLIFVLLVFKLLYSFGGEPHSFAQMMNMIYKGDIVLVILWYMFVIMAFYVLLAVTMKLVDSGHKLLAVMAFLCVLYIWLGESMKMGQWWFNTCHLLVLGLAWAIYEQQIRSFLEKFYWPCLLLAALLFLLLWQYFDTLYALWPVSAMRLIISLFRNAAFAIAFVLMTMKLAVGNPVLDRLGTVSLELYVLHPLFLLLFRGNILWLETDFLYCVAVIAATIIAAVLLAVPNKALCSMFKKI